MQDWEGLRLPLAAIPHCMTVGVEGFDYADAARLFALTFVRHRIAWRRWLAEVAAKGIQPAAGQLAEALALSEAIVRREMLRPEKGEPLAAVFTLPIPGLAGQYGWDMRNAAIALAAALWDERDMPEHGLGFAELDASDRAEMAEAFMLAEIVMAANGLSPSGRSEGYPPGKATEVQRNAWYRLTTAAGHCPAA